METGKPIITVDVTVNAPAEKVWEYFTKPEHIIKWNNASEDWHTPKAENDLREGGSFIYRMEAKNGSFGFDFGGTYNAIDKNKCIEYTLGDGRKVKIEFDCTGNTTQVTQNFEAENTHPVEMQKQGWQNILNNFRRYTEEN